MPDGYTTETPGAEVRKTCVPVRVKFQTFGVSRAFADAESLEVARIFEADAKAISPRKKLVDDKFEHYRAVVKAKHKADEYWKDNTLPFPEPGIRLLKQDGVDPFNTAMALAAEAIRERTADLQDHYDEFYEASKAKAGRLHDPALWPKTFIGLFGVTWDWPHIEPPPYLLALNPEVYQAEARRVSKLFDRAAVLHEEAFAQQLHDLVTHLSEKLKPGEDGKVKVFRDSAVDNLRNFFDRFKRLSVTDESGLKAVVAEAEAALGTTGAKLLRLDAKRKESTLQALEEVRASLEQQVGVKPRRRLNLGGGNGSGRRNVAAGDAVDGNPDGGAAVQSPDDPAGAAGDGVGRGSSVEPGRVAETNPGGHVSSGPGGRDPGPSAPTYFASAVPAPGLDPAYGAGAA